MEFIADLWLPIVAAAVFVFIVSSIIHMVLPIHKKDFKKLPSEEAILEAMRSHSLSPGQYMFPHAECMKDMGSPDMIAKYNRGPAGTMVVIPAGTPAIGKSLIQWFLFSLTIGVFVAYVASRSLATYDPYLTVFRLTGTVAFLAYGLSSVPESIWKGVPWSVTARFIFDGLLYALVTAGAFAWLWPSP
jgi:hypothetical protein